MASQQKEQRRLIFEDTQNIYSSNEFLKKAIDYSKDNQIVISGDWSIPVIRGGKYTEPAKVVVSKKRSLKAAEGYPFSKVCVHNFASASNPGGGVTKGSNAQEEAICRCSTLYPCISDEKIVAEFYDAHRELLKAERMNSSYNNDCIFTPKVIVFKDDIDMPTLLPEDSWYEVDVISCAAPNLRNKPSNLMNPDSGSKKLEINQRELLDLHMRRISRILNVALLHNEEVIILGAFGCGAFQNPPNIVAEAMARVVKEYLFCFRVIEFAVYCQPNDSTNYDVFSRRLSSLCK